MMLQQRNDIENSKSIPVKIVLCIIITKYILITNCQYLEQIF